MYFPPLSLAGPARGSFEATSEGALPATVSSDLPALLHPLLC